MRPFGLILALLIILGCALVSDSTESKAFPISIAEFRNGSFNMHLAELENILLRPEYADKQIAIVSIVGAARTGKSFLLNFFIMYLKAIAEGRISQQSGDWMSFDGLQGFRHATGSKPVTNGIDVYPNPFLIKNNASGQDLVVLLMDTQGAFAEDTTAKDCATIFSFSSLISSHMIYNTMRHFQEYNFRHLRLSSDIAKMFVGSNFYESLTFLVRDFELSDNLGKLGGEEYFEKFIKPNVNQSSEARELREAIISSFNHLNAFLLPRPGKAVAGKSFNGTIEDIDEEFRQYVAELIENVPLRAKVINSNTVTCSEWLQYLKEYGAEFEKGAFEVESIYKTTCKLSGQQAVERMVTKYREEVEKVAYETGNTADVIKTAIDELSKTTVLCGVKQVHLDALRKRLNAMASVQKTRGEQDRERARQEKELAEYAAAARRAEEARKRMFEKMEEERRRQERLDAIRAQEERQRRIWAEEARRRFEEEMWRRRQYEEELARSRSSCVIL